MNTNVVSLTGYLMKFVSTALKLLILYPVLSLAVVFSACGDSDGDSKITLSGSLELNEESEGPAFVIISRDGDIDAIQENPMDYVVEMVMVDPLNNSFSFDLSETDLKAGEGIFILGFVDNNYKGGIPNPNEGDYIGFYFDRDSWQTSYILKEGLNENLNIDVNRRVYDFDAEISGTILGYDEGDVIIVAYAGNLNSMDYDDFDVDGVVGFKKISKGVATEPYVLTIMPFGYNVPIENVMVLGILDANRNGKPDAGDKMGFYHDEESEFPSLITITEEPLKNIDIEPVMLVTAESGYDVPLNGSVELPFGEYYTEDSKPVYLIAASADNPGAILDGSLDSIKYFKRLEPEDAVGDTVGFSIDLSETDLKAGDEIMIAAIWDRNFVAGFPYPDPGDYIGLYIDEGNLAYSYVLKEPENDFISIKLDREAFDFECNVKGAVIGDAAPGSKVLVLAYAGELKSFDFKTGIDFAKVVGFLEITKNERYTNYSMDILPYGVDIPMDVYLFAFLDNNGNGIPDGGDLLGYHATADNMPLKIRIDEDIINKDKDIELLLELNDPAGYKIPLTGTIQMPDGQTYGPGSKPMFLIIAESDSLDAFIGSFDTSVVKYFTEVQRPGTASGTVSFSVDLSQTDLVAGDQVFVAAFWDVDDVGGSLDYPTKGDYLGFYVDAENFSPGYTLRSIPPNNPIDFKLSRQAYDFAGSPDPYVTGSITGMPAAAADVLVVAYGGELNSFDFLEIDFDAVIGYKQYAKADGVTTMSYSLPILPFINEDSVNVTAAGMEISAIHNVYIMAMVDNNGNGRPDGGDTVGFYLEESGSGMRLPGLVELTSGELPNINIEMMMDLAEPSGDTISIKGEFEIPAGGYSSNPATGPVYIVVLEQEANFFENLDITRLLSNPGVIKQLYKVPQGQYTFDIDLSSSDLQVGDKAFLIAVWDRDHEAGFVNPSAGDYVGYFRNKDEYIFSVVLEWGENDLTTSEYDGYDFKLDKKWYDHNASIVYRFKEGYLNNYSMGDDLIVFAVQQDGVTLSVTDVSLNIDYLVGMAYVKIDANTFASTPAYYNLELLPFQYEPIVNSGDFSIDSVGIFAVHDANGDGMPSEGERIAYYYYSILYLVYLPAYFDVIDAANLPEYMADRGVWFSSMTSPFSF